MQAKFTKKQINTSQTSAWFSQVKEKSPLTINFDELKVEAEFLDSREETLARQYNWCSTAKGNWSKRFSKLNYHQVSEGKIVEKTAQKLTVNGFTHIAGMVASGKSTRLKKFISLSNERGRYRYDSNSCLSFAIYPDSKFIGKYENCFVNVPFC